MRRLDFFIKAVLALFLTSLVPSSLGLWLPKAARRFLSGGALATATCLVDPWSAAAMVTPKAFDFSSGHVRIEDPLIIKVKENKTWRLSHPVMIGYGGGGAVFAMDNVVDSADTQPQNFPPSPTKPLVKISWTNSAASVRKECDVLQYLESKAVPHTETCWASIPYPHDKDNRAMIVVTPYVEHAVASVSELASPVLQQTAVQDMAQFLVQMLTHDVITIDVQPLISTETGHVTFIDMTEAQVLSFSSSNNKNNFANQTLMASFCAEIMALIPEQWTAVAADAVRHEMQQASSLSTMAKEILYSHFSLFPEQADG